MHTQKHKARPTSKLLNMPTLDTFNGRGHLQKSLTIWYKENLRGLLLIGNEDSTYAIDQEYDSSKVKVARIHQMYCKIW